jgi:hypothetical protein
MKKLFTLLFTAVLAFSLAMPVFAQDAGSQEAPKAEKKSKEKKPKAKKAKKEKKTEEAPKQ